jgi:quinolinate synthase
MAETAAILCPDKIVVMPDVRAGCPMADMITGPQLRAMKRQYPKAAAVCYINTSAEVKAESDIVCTSGNAVKVCQSLAEKEIIFVPDQYLGNWVSQQVKDKKFILWNGYCHIHTRILPEVIVEIKKLHPGAEVMVHPECTPAVIALADKVLGTGGMVKYAKESKAKEFIIGTESGLIHRLQKENPDKKFYPAADNVICPNMKLITLEKVLWSLQDLETKITVEREISVRAKKAIARMLENV